MNVRSAIVSSESAIAHPPTASSCRPAQLNSGAMVSVAKRHQQRHDRDPVVQLNSHDTIAYG